ncbi:MAG TPA: hypothetical protein ENK67_05815 [Flavobacteriia bacterium]|nr:hypothetical protein [Flavobacteriia bacterium]
MSFVLTTVTLQQIKAQDKPLAFLKDYYRTAVFAEYAKNYSGQVFKEDNSINYDILDFVTPNLGVTINIYQYKNWNFKTGFVLKYKLLRQKQNLTKEQTGRPYDYKLLTTLSSDDRMNAVPLIAEYILPISKRTKWLISGSFTFAYYRGQEGGGVTIMGVNSPNPITFLKYYDGYEKNPLFTSAEISTGFYFLFKHFMLLPEIRYSKSFRDVFTGHYTIENLVTEPHNSSGTFKQSGDYWGISLSIYIKKRGKNKKRKKKK